MPSAAKWDERFRSGRHASSEPDAFLSGSRDFWALPPSSDGERSAIDVACGAGRHAVFLARAGFTVTAVDFSAEALGLARRRAERAGLAIELSRLDLESPAADLGSERFDLTAVFYYLHRPLFDALKRSLKPGGLLVYKTCTIDQLAAGTGPRNPDFLLAPNELLRAFSEFRVLRYEEEWDGRGSAALIAQKPVGGASRRK